MIRIIVTHVVERVRYIASNPVRAAELLFIALISAFFWPSLTPKGLAPWGLSAPGEGAMVALAVIGVLWIGFFPPVLGLLIRPAVTGGARSCAVDLGHPALPIPDRVRIFTEAITGMMLIGTLRFPMLFLRDWIVGETDLYPANVTGPFALGALVLLPAFILVLGRWKSMEHAFSAAALTGIILSASMPLGGLATPLRLTLLTLSVSAIALWIAGRRPSGRFAMPNLLGVGTLQRNSMAPELRMRFDFAQRAVLIAIPFCVAELLAMWTFAEGLINGMTFYFASTLVFSLLIGFVVLRPMGSAQVIAGVWGKAGYQPGDFARAFSVLPVRRELMLRTVWLHGFVTGSLAWLACVLVGAFNARIALGKVLFFTDSDGRLIAALVLPLLAMIPCAAGFLVEGAAGDRKMAFMSGALLFLAPQIMFIMLIAGASGPGLFVVMSFVALLGGLPSFRHFHPESIEW